MKLFGHYIARIFVLFACLDGVLFLALLRLLGLQHICDRCYIGSLIHLKVYQSLLLTTTFLVITTSVGLYNNDATQDFRTFLKRFVLAWQLIFLPAVAFLAVTKAAAGAPFGWYVGIISLAISLFMLVLFSLRVVLVWGLGLAFLKKRIVVLGDGRMAEAVTDFVEGPGRSHFRHVHTIRDWRPAHIYAATVGNLKLQGPLEDPVPLSVVAELLRAEEIVVAVEDKRGLPVAELLECKLKGIAVVDALTFWEREAGQIDAANAGAGWLTFSGGFAFDQRHRLYKRIADLVISSAFVAAMAPLALFVALAIRLESPGPVFYRQERVGLNGRVFRLWKFRSMRADAERDGVPRWAKASDDRVTRVGRFIRKVRIDEIPQVINVLAGDMSFIGPRPERPFFVEQLKQQIPHYDLRHRVRPGITGWAQVNYPYGASIEDAKRKLSYDLYYLKKNDLLLDFAILMQTVRVILFAHGSR
ncbi:MAG: Sugar transferase, system associated/exopolysaccharide glycosylphosphotransferase [Phenylobacterium sp.]|nr:Sugar transferase, system associated/exopolysaccharide glycosylphosphotransferase [Phenylobacterium sp.]